MNANGNPLNQEQADALELCARRVKQAANDLHELAKEMGVATGCYVKMSLILPDNSCLPSDSRVRVELGTDEQGLCLANTESAYYQVTIKRTLLRGAEWSILGCGEIILTGCTSEQQAKDQSNAVRYRVREKPRKADLSGYEFNSPEVLPPVGCELVLKVGEEALVGFRTSYLTDKSGEMEYRLSDNSLISGRFPWTYP